MLRSLADLRLIELNSHARADGEVVVAEVSDHVPFSVARMFTLRAPLAAERGKHAHRLCSQLMLCVHGAIGVVCDDGSDRRTFELQHGNLALLVPPSIWNTVIFREENSVLVVLCDRHYEEHDYIRNYPEFVAYRKTARA